jgi:chemotaxis protein MotB
MKRSRRPWRLRPSPLFLLLPPLLLLAPGCVTRGRYQELEGERDGLAADKRRLEERVRLLEASSASLGAERAQLIDEMEDLRQAHEQLDRDVKRLRAAEAELSRDLAAREEQLAARTAEVEQLRGTYEGLVADLEAELAAGQIEITQLREGLQLDLAQDILFPSGSPEVNAGGRAVLGKVAERVREMPYLVIVQGHTDDVPISTERFPSNWELAAARASRVVRILAQQGVNEARLSAVSFASYRPRAPNDSSEGRARNRRIEITLKPLEDAPVAATPGGAAPGQAAPASRP